MKNDTIDAPAEEGEAEDAEGGDETPAEEAEGGDETPAEETPAEE